MGFSGYRPTGYKPAVLTDSSGGAATDGTIGAITLPTALTDSSGGSASATLAALTNSMAGYVYYVDIAAAADTGGAAQLDLNGVSPGATMASIAQPDVPRNVKITVTDGDTSISAFDITVAGTAPDGSSITENFVFAGGLVQAGVKVFAKVTSVTLNSITGSAAGDTLDFGYATKLGVPVPFGATGLSIVKLVTAGTEESPSATDSTNNSFIPGTAPNGTRDYEVWFEYSHPALTVLVNHVASLAARQAENRTAIDALQDAIAEVAGKVNAVIAAM